MCYNPKSVISLLRADKPSFCHLSCRFSVTMGPHCALKSTIHLFKNIVCYYHNANERFGIIVKYGCTCTSEIPGSYSVRGCHRMGSNE